MSDQDNRNNVGNFEHDILNDGQKSHKGGTVAGIIVIIAILAGAYYLNPAFKSQFSAPLNSKPKTRHEEKSTPPPHVAKNQTDKVDLSKYHQAQPKVKTEYPVVRILGKDKQDEAIAAIKKKTAAISHNTHNVGQYRVQVGTYLYKSSLIKGMKILSSLGLEGHGQRWTVTLPQYKIMVGKFHNAEEPREIVKKMCNDAIDAKFEILGTNLYSISVGNYYEKKVAFKIKDDLILKGYNAWLSLSKGKKRVYVLRLKGDSPQKDAMEKIKTLRSKGIEAVLIKK